MSKRQMWWSTILIGLCMSMGAVGVEAQPNSRPTVPTSQPSSRPVAHDPSTTQVRLSQQKSTSHHKQRNRHHRGYKHHRGSYHNRTYHKRSSHGHHHGPKGKPSAKKALSPRAALRHDLYFLSHPVLEGRDAGTRGIAVAADYIAHQFRTLKLKPIGDQKSYHQKFKTTTGVKLGKGNELYWVGYKSINGLGRNREFIPFGFSSNGTQQAPVVFAGYGITDRVSGYDDYKGIDVKGKIVLLFRYTPHWRDKRSIFGKRRRLYASFRYKVLNARTHGAVGVMIVNPPFPQSKKNKAKPALLTRLSLSRGLSDAGLLAVHVSTYVGQALFRHKNLDMQKEWQAIEQHNKPRSQAIGITAKLTVNLQRTKATIHNVVGILPGSDPTLSKQAIVLGAHYDHLGYGHVGAFPGNQGAIHTGADDNASGTALMMAQARYFAKHRPKRTLIFVAFAGEERGLLGSAHFVRNPPIPLSRIVTMLNFDMVGRLRNKRLMVQGTGTSPKFNTMLKALNTTHSFDLRMRESGYGPSDHTSFYARRIPVLFFFTGAHTDYHRPSDRFTTLNIPGIAKISRFVCEVVGKLDSDTRPPAYRKVKRNKRARKVRGGMRAYLGSIPDYGSTKTNNGVLLTGVRADGPADKGGIRGGDTIVKIGRFPIRNLYDMVIALKEHSPFENVDVIVMRKGKRLTRVVTLGRRGSSRR